MMITLPIFMPIIKNLGFDGVWFCLIMLVNLEVAMKTPPFGFLLFIMRGVTGGAYSIGQICRSTFPFVIIDIIAMGVMTAFPKFVLLLPDIVLR
jgi:TRAP-type mannitol/chloroaromatic compound transport system permease large subunit